MDLRYIPLLASSTLLDIGHLFINLTVPLVSFNPLLCLFVSKGLQIGLPQDIQKLCVDFEQFLLKISFMVVALFLMITLFANGFLLTNFHHALFP